MSGSQDDVDDKERLLFMPSDTIALDWLLLMLLANDAGGCTVHRDTESFTLLPVCRNGCCPTCTCTFRCMHSRPTAPVFGNWLLLIEMAAKRLATKAANSPYYKESHRDEETTQIVGSTSNKKASTDVRKINFTAPSRRPIY